MEDRIQLERRGLEPNEVEHLNLDNIKAKRITGLSDEYKALKTLSMINVGLTSLEACFSFIFFTAIVNNEVIYVARSYRESNF